MIQVLMLISALGILFLFKYLTWFLDESYDEEEKLIEETLTRRKYFKKVSMDKISRNTMSNHIHFTGNIKRSSGFEFYSFENEIIGDESDNDNAFANDRCA